MKFIATIIRIISSWLWCIASVYRNINLDNEIFRLKQNFHLFVFCLEWVWKVGKNFAAIKFIYGAYLDNGLFFLLYDKTQLMCSLNFCFYEISGFHVYLKFITKNIMANGLNLFKIEIPFCCAVVNCNTNWFVLHWN